MTIGQSLTSHIMKVMERLVLAHLINHLPAAGPNTLVCVMFLNVSSAFNTIQPRLLKAKLENMQVHSI